MFGSWTGWFIVHPILRPSIRSSLTCIANFNEIVLITEADPINEPGPRIISVNEAFERITGYASAKALGRSPRFLRGKNTDLIVLEEIHHAPVQRQAIRRQVLSYRKNGAEYWMDLDLVPIFDAAGKCTHFVAIERDITAEKKNEAQLLWKTTSLEAQLDSSIDGILVVDCRGKKILQNRRLNELWKIPRHVLDDKNDAAQAVFAANQTKDPQQFTGKVTYLYDHPDESSHDEIELIAGGISVYSEPGKDTVFLFVFPSF